MDIRPSDSVFTASAVTPPASVPVLLGPTGVEEGRSPELIKDQKEVGTVGATSSYDLVADAPLIDAPATLTGGTVTGDPLAGIPGILPASGTREVPVISQMSGADALPRLSNGLKASDFPTSSVLSGGQSSGGSTGSSGGSSGSSSVSSGGYSGGYAGGGVGGSYPASGGNSSYPDASPDTPSTVPASTEKSGKTGKSKKSKKSKKRKNAPANKQLTGTGKPFKMPDSTKAFTNYLMGKIEPMEKGQMNALEAEFGKFKGKGLNTKPTERVGPMGGTLLHKAYDALAAGDIKTAQKAYSEAQKTVSPVMLDLDGDGKLGTTGVSTAKNRIDGQVGKTVSFDIDGDGKKDQIEWMKGGDGMLVDDRDGGATAAMNGNGEIDGKRLFGDEGGKFGNGFDKLRQLDRDGDGKLTGAELDGLKVWVDNGDARVGGGELKSLRDLGVTEISVQMKLEQNDRGEDLMRSSFVQNGQSRVSEDVWFAQQ